MATQANVAIKYVKMIWPRCAHLGLAASGCRLNMGYFAKMETRSDRNFLLLVDLKARYGDLNTALVAEYLQAYGDASISAIAQDVGLSRAAVRRALQKLSDSDSLAPLDAC
ncbi:AsnC family protein [Pseudooceanicola marinus]|uniref:AsnC family protein n=1 Tax=Pseudooceanicola marinus TaxID=396013 RepID=UPI00117A1400|nr:AsnC family protein [Pseudooceanicola marinus]